MTARLYTIGHSNHDLEAFVALLKRHKITALADVRSKPQSRYLTHFCQAPLRAVLQRAGIRYVFLGRELGARPDDASCYVDGTAEYNLIAQTPAFTAGLNRVVTGTQQFTVALMCAEKDPLTCHRAILVCQHLKSFDLDICYILSDGALESHAQLEGRLLAAHNLGEDAPPEQLSLFESRPTRSPAQSLQEAYERQADQLAYRENAVEAES